MKRVYSGREHPPDILGQDAQVFPRPNASLYQFLQHLSRYTLRLKSGVCVYMLFYSMCQWPEILTFVQWVFGPYVLQVNLLVLAYLLIIFTHIYIYLCSPTFL